MFDALIRWKGYLAASVIAFVAGAASIGYVQQLRIDAVRGDLKVAQNTNTTLRANNDACAVNVATANTAVKALKDAADARAKAAKDALAAAEVKAKQQEAAIATLARRPPSSADSCVAIKDLRTDYMRLRR